MKRHKPVNYLAKLLLGAAFGLSVMQGAMAADGDKLVVASFYPVDKVSGWDGMVAAFKEKYGEVDIEVQVTPLAQYLPKLLSQIAGGDSPDVIAIENTPFPQFVQRSILEDLTDRMEGSETFKPVDFYPYLLDRYTVEGRVYGIPYDAQPYAMLYYDPAAFEAAGLGLPTDNWSWEDMREAAAALTDASSQKYGLCLSSSNINNWRYFLFTGGGSYVDDGKSPTRSTLGDEASIQATEFYVDMMTEDKSIPTVDAMTALGGASQNCPNFLLNAKAAMMIGGTWKAVENAEAMREKGIKLALGPTRDPNARVYPTGGTAYAILRSSDNKDLAWAFMQEFLGRSGHEAAYREAKLGAIYPPAHKPSFEWYMDQEITFLDTLKPNADALAYVRFEPFRTDWAEIRSQCVEQNLDSVLSGQSDADVTLTEMAACIDGAL